MCRPLPGCSGRGLGEKSAQSPFAAATLRTTERKVRLLSAAESGSE